MYVGLTMLLGREREKKRERERERERESYLKFIRESKGELKMRYIKCRKWRADFERIFAKLEWSGSIHAISRLDPHENLCEVQIKRSICYLRSAKRRISYQFIRVYPHQDP